MRTPLYISDFRIVRPHFEQSQEDILDWLAQAHAAAESAAGHPARLANASPEHFARLIRRFGCSPESIAFRGHELSDFTSLEWGEMHVFNVLKHPAGADMESRQRAYDRLVRAKCDDLYLPSYEFGRDLIHVSCTGYLAPSPPQRLIVERGFAGMTRVVHAYHMGCYAALPATRMAGAMALQQQDAGARAAHVGVDVVHTELCSLHLNPLLHSPEQLVVQSLFADGFIRYRILAERPDGVRSVKILSMNEEQIPDSAAAMTWLPLPWGMAMTLSPEVPKMIAGSVRGFVDRLIQATGRSVAEVLPRLVYAIHPGGPKIIDNIQRLLEIPDARIAASRQVLRNFGNMSSATLPHVWATILADETRYPAGSVVLSLAFGPGLTMAGSLFEIVGAAP